MSKKKGRGKGIGVGNVRVVENVSLVAIDEMT